MARIAMSARGRPSVCAFERIGEMLGVNAAWLRERVLTKRRAGDPKPARR